MHMHESILGTGRLSRLLDDPQAEDFNEELSLSPADRTERPRDLLHRCLWRVLVAQNVQQSFQRPRLLRSRLQRAQGISRW